MSFFPSSLMKRRAWRSLLLYFRTDFSRFAWKPVSFSSLSLSCAFSCHLICCCFCHWCNYVRGFTLVKVDWRGRGREREREGRGGIHKRHLVTADGTQLEWVEKLEWDQGRGTSSSVSFLWMQEGSADTSAYLCLTCVSIGVSESKSVLLEHSSICFTLSLSFSFPAQCTFFSLRIIRGVRTQLHCLSLSLSLSLFSCKWEADCNFLCTQCILLAFACHEFV